MIYIVTVSRINDPSHVATVSLDDDAARGISDDAAASFNGAVAGSPGRVAAVWINDAAAKIRRSSCRQIR